MFLSVKELIWHFKVFHNLSDQSLFICSQGACVRDFKNLSKFRRHLNNDHSILQCVESHIDFNSELPSLPISDEIPLSTIHTCDADEYESFEDNVRSSAISFLSELHMNTSMTSNLVQKIINGVTEFISNGILPHLKIAILSILNISNEIQKKKNSKYIQCIKKSLFKS